METKQRTYASSALVRGYFTIDPHWLESLKFILNPVLDVPNFPSTDLLQPASQPSGTVILNSTDPLQHSS